MSAAILGWLFCFSIALPCLADECPKKLDGYWEMTGRNAEEKATVAKLREAAGCAPYYSFDVAKLTFVMSFKEKHTGAFIIETCAAREMRLILTAKDEAEKALMIITFDTDDQISAVLKDPDGSNEGVNMMLVRKKE